MRIPQKLSLAVLGIFFVCATVGLGVFSQELAEGADRDALKEQRLAEREQLKDERFQKRRDFLMNQLARQPPCGADSQGQPFGFPPETPTSSVTTKTWGYYGSNRPVQRKCTGKKLLAFVKI